MRLAFQKVGAEGLLQPGPASRVFLLPFRRALGIFLSGHGEHPYIPFEPYHRALAEVLAGRAVRLARGVALWQFARREAVQEAGQFRPLRRHTVLFAAVAQW